MRKPVRTAGAWAVAVFAAAGLAACAPSGRTDRASFEAGDSAKFGAAEIEAARAQVLEEFKSKRGCELLRLWYDEDVSNAAVADYLQYGGGSQNGAAADDVMVLLSDFHAGRKADPSLNRGSDYTDWLWILVRNESGAWEVKDQGR
ncbi:MAG: hypothetical protein LBG60_05115 [Bifidobacteriaceae bacterium]|jgi:hypothetical protein|nr:hypothetical protein [Bifidobacteriaceae bacterium]